MGGNFKDLHIVGTCIWLQEQGFAALDAIPMVAASDDTYIFYIWQQNDTAAKIALNGNRAQNAHAKNPSIKTANVGTSQDTLSE